ncbi:hypothetical protein T4C_266 [Trichinella pseudospiralis]|uniref:Uncharacterized protein n=1 Tax=Trichinella pseudospiralis TaxID=6337 RepID=A0A0V1JRU7_TRIPS|nr:hypothetical protein T4C_266 [Trichinella pseudospiralis]
MLMQAATPDDVPGFYLCFWLPASRQTTAAVSCGLVIMAACFGKHRQHCTREPLKIGQISQTQTATVVLWKISPLLMSDAFTESKSWLNK